MKTEAYFEHDRMLKLKAFVSGTKLNCSISGGPSTLQSLNVNLSAKELSIKDIRS